jgi:hypothetical protein
VLRFRVPRNYPQRCTGVLDCLTNSRDITAQLTINVTGTPLQPLASSNMLDIKPLSAGSSSSSSTSSWTATVPLQLSPGMSSFRAQRAINAPGMQPGSQYRVTLLTTSNGWRDLRVALALEYVP